MHDEILDNIVCNAFNGFGDIIGSDDFGVSIAWIDLDDFLENYVAYEERDTDELSAEFKDYVGGQRWVLAYIYADGRRDTLAFETKAEMMDVFRSFEADFNKFEDEEYEGE